MAISNYTDLQLAVANWLDRDDLTARIPEFISLLEAELRRDPAVEDERFSTITLANPTEALPAEVREITDLFYNDTSSRRTIDVTSAENVARQVAQLTPTGRPRFAALIANGTQLLLGPAPDQSYTAFIQYIAKLVSLSAAQNGTNWLMTDHPDIYLYGTLMQSAPYLKDDGRVALWSMALERAKASLSDFIKRRKYSANTPIARPRRTIG